MSSKTLDLAVRAREALRSRITGIRAERRTGDITFLIPHFNSPEFLSLTVQSVRRFHGDCRILVADSTSSRRAYAEARRECARHSAEMCALLGKHSHTGLLNWLMRHASTSYAVVLDQDCILLDSLDKLLERMGSSVLLAGPRDEMILTHPNLRGVRPDLFDSPLRRYPEFVHASLMATRPRIIRRRYGRYPFSWDRSLGERAYENYYGLSRRLSDAGPENILMLESRHTGYGLGMVYLLDGHPIAYHNWYSGRISKVKTTIDGVDVRWLRAEMDRFLADYRNGRLELSSGAISS
jgi:hypothetical protein